MTPRSDPHNCDVAVVGAGAAGFMAAIAAAEAGARTTLFNAHLLPGLKILMSGGTRCNVTHVTVGPESFHAASRPAVGLVLKTFPAGAVRAWFEEQGVPLKEEPGGKLFPVSNSARTVVERLLATASG
ncbi:MAG TPA: NAD(P)/FAD-dependent oxidoreductase, partial [Candidatus Eisenbacteria bacterium]